MSTDAMRRYVRDALLRHAEASGWSALGQIAGSARGIGAGGPPDLALRACRAAGGREAEAYPAAASLHALHAAIQLVDDVIDGEERSIVDLPPGLRANLAMALQCIAIELLADAPGAVRAPLMLAAAAAGRETARGQELDAAGAADEDGYWRIVEAKTPPLFAAALRMGALSGGAPAIAEELAAAGVPLGVLVQLGDDLGDVMGAEIHPDWERPGNNVALRFALEADHPDRARFHALVPRVPSDQAAHAEAKEILVRSGAFAFCVHHMRGAADAARRAILAVPLAHPTPVLEFVDRIAAPVDALLAELGVAPVERGFSELEPSLA
jgi:geranylgeranyl pyrophosphate synthase